MGHCLSFCQLTQCHPFTVVASYPQREEKRRAAGEGTLFCSWVCLYSVVVCISKVPRTAVGFSVEVVETHSERGEQEDDKFFCDVKEPGKELEFKRPTWRAGILLCMAQVKRN